MRLDWTTPAIRDLVALRAYIAEHDPRAAAGMAQKILQAVEALTTFPASGRPGKKPETRDLVIPGTPFFAVYRVKGETVEIVRVIHGRQRWP